MECNYSMFAMLSVGIKFSEEEIATVSQEALLGLSCLHDNHIFHRTRSETIAIASDGHIKCTDWDMYGSRPAPLGRNYVQRGAFFMSPEITSSPSAESNIWSLGITLIEMADGQVPLGNLHPMRAIFMIPKNPSPTLKNPSAWSTKEIQHEEGQQLFH
mmetsp:Transcript_4170/g.5840  ORF Transcript_4170/g.5840 Transcript_4170/m.5840 type:complete len:158 (+) Transcript_4170:43-516(+)